MNELQALTQAIERIGTNKFPVEIDLWDASTVAAYLKISKSRLTNYYANRPDFPSPGRLPSDKGAGRPLWRAREIIKWANDTVFESADNAKSRRQ